MREKLIEAMARGYTGAPFPSKRAIARSAIALDAALDLLETPSEEMVRAGVLALNKSGIDDVEDRDAEWCLSGVLATLRSPKI